MSKITRRHVSSAVVASLLAVGLPLGIAGASHTAATIDFAQSANYLRSTDGGDDFDPQSLDSEGHGVNQGTQVAAEDGVVHALFGTFNDDDDFVFPFEVHHRRSTNGGRDFGPSQRVDNHDLGDPTGAEPGTQGASSEPSMATDGDGVYVVFEEGDFDFGLDVNDDGLDPDDEFPEEVFFNRSLDEGESFGTSFNLSETEFAQETDSDTAASGNRVVAVYETNQIDPGDFDTEPVIPVEQATTARDIAIRVSDDRGAEGSFAPPINLTIDGTSEGPFAADADPDLQGQDQPKVALTGDGPDDVVIVVFRVRTDDDSVARTGYVRVTDGGQTVGDVMLLPSDVNVEDLPAIHMEGDTAHVFACDVTNRVLHWQSADAGATFSGPAVMHTAAERCQKPEVDGNGDDIHLVFLEEVAGEPDVFHMHSDDGGASWSEATNLTANHGQGEFPSVAVDPEDEDDVHITWQDVSDFFFSTKYGGEVPAEDGDDLDFANEDVVRYHGATYEIVMDGSDVGLRNLRIDAMAMVEPEMPAGLDRFILSFTESGRVPGIEERVDDSDLVLFTPSSLGEDTDGTFTLILDGSEIGLSRSGEDIDVVELDGSDLFLSTYGNFALDEVAYPGVEGKNEDIFVCRNATTTSCAGGAEVLFDGSERELDDSGEGIDAFAFGPDGNGPDSRAFFSTRGDFETSTAEGEDGDLFKCLFPELDGPGTRDGDLSTCNDGGADSQFRTVYVGDVNRMDEDIMSVEIRYGG